MTAVEAPDHRKLDTRAFAAVVIGAIAMGISPIFVRLADVGPFSSAFWRVALALPFFWIWMTYEARSNRRTAPTRGNVLKTPAVILAGLFFAGDLFFWHLSIVKTTVANATFFATMSPVFVLLASYFLFGERFRRNHLFGLALCITGGAMLISTSLAFAPSRLTGDVFGLITGMFFAAYIITMGRARIAGLPAGAIMFWSTAITALALLPFALIFEDALWPSTINGIMALFALALVAQVGGQGLLAYALGQLPASFSSLVIFLEGVAAAVFGWVILAEALTPLQTMGAMVVFAGVVIARGASSQAIKK